MSSNDDLEIKRNVMIPIDPSKHAARAFTFYMDNIYREGDAIVFVHIVEPSSEGFPSPVALLTGAIPPKEFLPVSETKVKAAQDLCEYFINKATLSGRPLAHKASILLDNRPGQALVKACEDYKVDMVVMGNRGLGNLRRVFMGSVSDYVLHHCQRPVVIVPPPPENASQAADTTDYSNLYASSHSS